MNRFIMKIFVFLFVVTLWQVGIFEPLPVDIGGEVTVAEAHHKPGHTGGPPPDKDKCKKNPKFCEPPTVAELPIQYMVSGGIAFLVLSGGMVFFIRKRKMKNSLEG